MTLFWATFWEMDSTDLMLRDQQPGSSNSSRQMQNGPGRSEETEISDRFSGACRLIGFKGSRTVYCPFAM